MARFLIVVPPFAGHINPTIELGHELGLRGHEVAWAGYQHAVVPLIGKEAEFIAVGEDIPQEMVAQIQNRSLGLRGAAALEFLWKDLLIPLAHAMNPGVQSAIERFNPDLIISDQQAFAGAICARKFDIPWVTSATTSAELVDPFQFLPKVGSWVRDGLIALQKEMGVSRNKLNQGDLRFSEYLTLAYTTTALSGQIEIPSGSGPVVMVGPSMSAQEFVDSRRKDPDLPRDWLDSNAYKVLVSLGTVNAQAGKRFFSVTIEALIEAKMNAVVVAPPGLIDSTPDNIIVRERIPQLAVLEHVQAVVCHSGHNTVCESLANGLPLVLAPIRDDQPVIADQVVRAGAGIRVKFARVQTKEIHEALESVLKDPSFRIAAYRVKESFQNAGGASKAATCLEKLVVVNEA